MPPFRNESMFIRCVGVRATCVRACSGTSGIRKTNITGLSGSGSCWPEPKLSREGHAEACCYGLVALRSIRARCRQTSGVAHIDIIISSRSHTDDGDPNVNIHGICGEAAPCGLDYVAKWSSVSTVSKGSLPSASFATKVSKTRIIHIASRMCCKQKIHVHAWNLCGGKLYVNSYVKNLWIHPFPCEGCL